MRKLLHLTMIVCCVGNIFVYREHENTFDLGALLFSIAALIYFLWRLFSKE
jgi:uncharacterized membrane protein YhhN